MSAARDAEGRGRAVRLALALPLVVASSVAMVAGMALTASAFGGQEAGDRMSATEACVYFALGPDGYDAWQALEPSERAGRLPEGCRAVADREAGEAASRDERD